MWKAGSDDSVNNQVGGDKNPGCILAKQLTQLNVTQQNAPRMVRVVLAMIRSDGPFNAAATTPARTRCPEMLVAFSPALAATVLKITALES